MAMGTAKKSLSFLKLAETFESLENTSSGLQMITILAKFLSSASPDDARIAAYFIQGEIGPPYADINLGISTKSAISIIARATRKAPKDIQKGYGMTGDLGILVESLLESKPSGSIALYDVYQGLSEVASTTGPGSMEMKASLLVNLLDKCSPREAKYLVRLISGALRLGVADMTYLYSLSQAVTGSRGNKLLLESAYNVLSDLGEVSYLAVKEGIGFVKKVKPVLGIPIRFMLAQRIRDLEELKSHIPGNLFVEYKYDGERVQAHLQMEGEILLYSRRHENITRQFPEVAAALANSFRGKNCIIDGEIAAIDKNTGKLGQFQALMTRRRKYKVEEYIKKVPVRLFLFDVMYRDGCSLLNEPLTKRKRVLEQSFSPSGGIAFAEYVITEEPAEVEDFFAKAVDYGAEGVVMKDENGNYEAGRRGWKWIKYKKEYEKEMRETFDLAVAGATHGAGRRAGAFGSLLMASFDPESGKYFSFTKVGAGFTDKTLAELPKKLAKYRIPEKYHTLETNMEMDIWFQPFVVAEIAGGQITVSPVHTVARQKLKKGGLALRFPRFIRWRPDKSSEQATGVDEIYRIYLGTRRS